MILNSQRTVIKPIKESDIPDIIEMYSEPDAFEYVKPFQGKSVEFFKDFLQQNISTNKESVEFWTVRALYQGHFIGTVNLNKLVNSNRVQIGCHLKSDFWNNGLAYGVLQKILDYGINTLKLNEIYGIFESENIASKKLLKKLDFVPLEEKEIFNTLVNIFIHKAR